VPKNKGIFQMNEVKKHGIIEQYNSQNWVDECWCELDINGYTSFPSGLEKHNLDYFLSELERIYKIQAEEVGGEGQLKKINDLDIVRAPLGYNNHFINSIWTDNMKTFIKKTFKAGYTLISQNGLLNQSNKQFYQEYYHRDMNYNHFTSSRPLAITAILCLDDFTIENGATHVIPGSHLVEKFPTDDFVKKHEKPVCVKAGNYIVFNSMLFHRASMNKSDKVRPGIAHVIGESFFGQQVNFPKMLAAQGIEKPASNELAGFLGYNWGTEDSAVSWRRKRIK
jgi:hypothetical protein